MLLRKSGLFYLDDFSLRAEKLYKQRLSEIGQREEEIRGRRRAISETSEVRAKAVNIGFQLERLAPSLKGFPFNRNDCRSLFEPIDYLIFDGLTRNGFVSRIIFADIKTGDATLKANQREIRRLVERKRVDWDTYGIVGD
jgi:predicted Holliday junction resolvase-like endonuclease